MSNSSVNDALFDSWYMQKYMCYECGHTDIAVQQTGMLVLCKCCRSCALQALEDDDDEPAQ